MFKTTCFFVDAEGFNDPYLFAYPPQNTTADDVAKKLLELLLMFGIPLSLRCDPGTEFTAEVVTRTSVNGAMCRSIMAPQITQELKELHKG